MKKKAEKNEQNLPGYPHYPESEDILGQAKRVDADVEDLSRSPKAANAKLKTRKPKPVDPDYSPEIVRGTKADVTKEDLKTLGARESNMDGGEDETLLPNLQIGPDLFGDDLDVPGSELDDDQEDIGSEDEENNYYSRGQE